MSDAAFELLELPRFRNELAQVGARAALAALDVESSVRWRYRAERVIRNLGAISQAVFDESPVNGAASARSAALAVAQGWEHLAALGERIHPSAALLNSALFYEVAGYQANATCLARMAVGPARWSADPTFDGLVSAFLQRMFLRVTTLRSPLTQLPDPTLLLTDVELNRRAAQAVTAVALSEASSFFLTGDESLVSAAMGHLGLARRGLAQAGDAVAFNAVVGLEHVLPIMVERSTWRHIRDVSESPRWRRYLKVLARGLGSDVLDGRSVSELWPSQRAAVEGGLLDDDQSLAVRMPTSAGKTRVAELAIVHTLATQPGAKCVFIAPYRALASPDVSVGGGWV